MGDAPVDLYPLLSQIGLDGIRGTKPVIGQPHQAAACSLNWLIGQGHMLVNDGPKFLYWPLDPGGGDFPTYSLFKYWIKPDAVHPTLILHITLRSIMSDGSYCVLLGSVEAPASFGTPFYFSAGQHPTTVAVRYDIAASNTPQEFSFHISSLGAIALEGPRPILLVDSIQVFEAPQQIINGVGVDTSSFDSRDPIYDGGSDLSSIATLAINTDVCKTAYYRRGGVYQNASFALAIAQTSSYVAAFPTPVPIQVPKLKNGGTLATVNANVHGWIGNGATRGDCRLTMTNGSTATFSITAPNALAGGGAWPGVTGYGGLWAGAQSMQVEVDDPSRWGIDGGIQGGTRDLCNVEVRVIGGGQFVLNGISIYDIPG